MIVETDSMLLKMATGGDNFALAPTGGLVHEIKATAASCFSSFDVIYCPRSCNKVAHALAAKGRMCPSNADMYWEGVPAGRAGTWAVSFLDGPWHDYLARSKHSTARNILGRAGTTRTRGSCRA